MRSKALFPLFGAILLAGCPASNPETPPPSGSTGSAASPAAQPASQPGSQPASGPSAAAEPSAQPVAGLIKLDASIPASSVKPTDVLFIMARESQGGGRAGRLSAVQRHGQLEFPKRYELSSKDAMVPGVPFKGPFVVYARLDKDGDPMTKGADDLYGAVVQPVNGGEQNAHIVLKKRAAGPASQPSSAPANPSSAPAK